MVIKTMIDFDKDMEDEGKRKKFMIGQKKTTKDTSKIEELQRKLVEDELIKEKFKQNEGEDKYAKIR